MEDEIVKDTYISKIDDVVGKVRMIIFEVTFEDIKVFELENQIIMLMSMKDDTGNMSAVLMGRKNDEIKNVIKTTNLKDRYRITGNIPFDLEYVYQGLKERINDDTKIKREMLKNKVLFVKEIQKIEPKKVRCNNAI